MYYITFAPDGEHWQTIKKFKVCQRAWDYLRANVDIRQQIAVNSYAKFRLLLDDRILAELPLPEIT
jgi:hypothetical protein